MLEGGHELPVELKGQMMYFVGPSPAQPGHPVGSAGPTTAGRMNSFISRLLAVGMRGFIGKGYLEKMGVSVHNHIVQ